jgi:hypothetical protein
VDVKAQLGGCGGSAVVDVVAQLEWMWWLCLNGCGGSA